MKNLIKLRYSSLFKNLSISLPLLVNREIKLNLDVIIIFFTGFFIFSIISLLVYVLNDSKDYYQDKKNKLKEKKKLIFLSKNTYLILNILLLIYIALIATTDFFGYSLLIYCITFIIYNNFLKKKKYFDIACLVVFHMLRLTYGAELFNVSLTFYFSIFFILFFLFLSVCKRIIQIKINNLKPNNNIICYSKIDLASLNNLAKISCLISILFFFLYLYSSIYKNIYWLDLIFLLLILFIYIKFIYEIIFLLKHNLLRKDLYIYIISNQKILLLAFITLIILVLRIIYI